MHAFYNIQIGTRQRRFLIELFRVLFAHQGRASFTNLARYSTLHEHTFRRHFARAFDWFSFNLVLVRLRAHPDEVIIGVFLRQLSAQEWHKDLRPRHVLLARGQGHSHRARSLALGRDRR